MHLMVNSSFSERHDVVLPKHSCACMLNISTKTVKTIIYLDIFLNMYAKAKYSKVYLYPTSQLCPLVLRITENKTLFLFLGFIP